MLVCSSGFFVFAHSFRHFLGHLGGEHFRMTCHHFTAVRKARVTDGENPKEGGNPDSDHRQHAEARKTVEDGIEDETTPFLAGEEIYGRDENEAEVDHVIFWLLFGWAAKRAC